MHVCIVVQKQMTKRPRSHAPAQPSAAAYEPTPPPPPPHVHDDESTLPQEWPFETDFGDHFETPRRAFKDLKPVRLPLWLWPFPHPPSFPAAIKAILQASLHALS
jgi:hypothetical protein